MRQSSVAFKSGNLTLEGVIAAPQDAGGSLPGVVVCHPHPLFGGDMDNYLVVTVCYDLVEAGFITLRFNFRGVGGSEGSFSKGEKEKEDVEAALELLKNWPGVNNRRIGLAGYSFGASVILSDLARYKSAKAFAFISPPLSAFNSLSFAKDKRPKLFITGSRDRLVPPASLKEKVDVLRPPVELQLVEDADHSWMRHEGEAARLVTQFFVGTLL